MTATPSTIRVVIPLAMKRRNGRPRIVPPDDVSSAELSNQQPHVLRAIARAWHWRRMLERGEITTIRDIASAEKVSDRFISRRIRLAYLSPAVLERLLITRASPAVSLNDLAAAAERPWAEQRDGVFDTWRE